MLTSCYKGLLKFCLHKTNSNSGLPQTPLSQHGHDPIEIGEWNRNPSPGSAFLDHTEILQGASDLLNGAGEPGGTINMVRKQPTRTFQAHAEAQLGSWNIEPEMPGGNSKNGFYDITVTRPAGETDHVEQISRHKQLTLIEIDTREEGTYR
ncbi:MAG: hypothetical protein LBP58_00735 [Azoarcus sp.]|jgi:hypothetical protein|nr:hypothetical protein [Azoarcus sp.]